MNKNWKTDIKKRDRFKFGKNWQSFLDTLTDERIKIAEDSIKGMLEVDNLKGKRFLDIGCGSGLFSLCAYRLGADVVSLDYDPDSVACAEFLRNNYNTSSANSWEIFEGSALDDQLFEKLRDFDIVYSWGVLHHTGEMYRALENASKPVRVGGKLFISIYNDQGKTSKRWLKVKKAYNWSPAPIKFLLLLIYIVRFTAIGTIKEIILLRPFKEWRNYKKSRGMSRIQNIRDWIGGLPFEVAKPEDIIFLYKGYDFELNKLVTCGGGIGCNEYVFTKIDNE